LNQSSPKDNVLLIKPTKESLIRLKVKIIQIFKNKTSFKSLIQEINPILRGWANYYRISWHANKYFHGIDNYLYSKTIRFLKRLHPTRPMKWLYKRYIHKHGNRNWRFGLSTKTLIYNLSETKILKLKILKSGVNPYFNLYYYEKNPRVFVLDERRRQIYKFHNFKCVACGKSLLDDEQIDLHHVTPKAKGGDNSYKNLVPLHKTCHVGITHARKQWFAYKSR
jgi:RNA-directed DNA polymerase